MAPWGVRHLLHTVTSTYVLVALGYVCTVQPAHTVQTQIRTAQMYLSYSLETFVILMFVREKIFVQVYSNPDEFLSL